MGIFLLYRMYGCLTSRFFLVKVTCFHSTGGVVFSCTSQTVMAHFGSDYLALDSDHEQYDSSTTSSSLSFRNGISVRLIGMMSAFLSSVTGVQDRPGVQLQPGPFTLSGSHFI